MANLTIVVDDQLLQAARIKALQQGTSVNEVCREAIERFAKRGNGADTFMEEWRALVARSTPGDAKPLPKRDAMYDEILAERMPTWHEAHAAGTSKDEPPSES